MNLHELKDIVMIYSSDQNGKPDYSWDKAEIVVWNPTEQREMKLYFTGSERPDEKHAGKINFNVDYKSEADQQNLFSAFDNTMHIIFPNISDATLAEYHRVFLQELYTIRTSKTKQE